MSWISSIFISLIFSSMVGCIFYLVCIVFSESFWRSFNPRIVYGGLKLSMLLMFVPVSYAGVKIAESKSGVALTFLPCITPRLNAIVEGLCVIWVLGMIVHIICNIHARLGFSLRVRSSLPVDKHVRNMLDRRCGELHIKRKVRMYRCYNISAPFVVGIIKPTIYIPVKAYTDYEMELIITHELYHCIHFDAIWRQIAVACFVIFWYNSLLIAITYYVDRWAEAYCDMCCVNHYRECDYFNSLLSIKVSEKTGYIPGFMVKRGDKDLLWRIKTMKRRMRSNIKRLGVVASLVGALFVGSVSSFAATDGLNKGYTELFLYSAGTGIDETNTDNNNDLEDNYVEYECDASEILGDEEVEEVPLINKTRSRNTYFVMDGIKAGGYKFTTLIKFYANSTVTITAVGTPSTVPFRVGIVQPNGSIRYVQGSDVICHTFNITTAGNYRVIIENKGTSTIDVEGMITKSE